MKKTKIITTSMIALLGFNAISLNAYNLERKVSAALNQSMYSTVNEGQKRQIIEHGKSLEWLNNNKNYSIIKDPSNNLIPSNSKYDNSTGIITELESSRHSPGLDWYTEDKGAGDYTTIKLPKTIKDKNQALSWLKSNGYLNVKERDVANFKPGIEGGTILYSPPTNLASTYTIGTETFWPNNQGIPLGDGWHIKREVMSTIDDKTTIRNDHNKINKYNSEVDEINKVLNVKLTRIDLSKLPGDKISYRPGEPKYIIAENTKALQEIITMMRKIEYELSPIGNQSVIDQYDDLVSKLTAKVDIQLLRIVNITPDKTDRVVDQNRETLKQWIESHANIMSYDVQDMNKQINIITNQGVPGLQQVQETMTKSQIDGIIRDNLQKIATFNSKVFDHEVNPNTIKKVWYKTIKSGFQSKNPIITKDSSGNSQWNLDQTNQQPHVGVETLESDGQVSHWTSYYRNLPAEFSDYDETTRQFKTSKTLNGFIYYLDKFITQENGRDIQNVYYRLDLGRQTFARPPQHPEVWVPNEPSAPLVQNNIWGNNATEVIYKESINIPTTEILSRWDGRTHKEYERSKWTQNDVEGSIDLKNEVEWKRDSIIVQMDIPVIYVDSRTRKEIENYSKLPNAHSKVNIGNNYRKITDSVQGNEKYHIVGAPIFNKIESRWEIPVQETVIKINMLNMDNSPLLFNHELMESSVRIIGDKAEWIPNSPLEKFFDVNYDKISNSLNFELKVNSNDVNIQTFHNSYQLESATTFQDSNTFQKTILYHGDVVAIN